jgi:MYXO-CTERM domain-containing protein
MDEQKQGVPEDPSGIEEPHDVLAAEEFGIGARDERLPPDPTGLHEPHDVLAAEEFAMPAGAEGVHGYGESRNWTPYLLAAAAVLLLLLRRRRR